MKRVLILCVSFLLISTVTVSQSLENLDFISPFNESIAAVKKGNQWAFIDTTGAVLIDFRDDVVLTQTENGAYPIFSNYRCKIKQQRDGITYFGFIDTKGKTVIEPMLLNATNFNNERAIVLLLEKDTVGSNEILKKPVVSYDYFEVLIDTKGEVVHYIIEAPTHVTLSKEFLKKPPKIKSQMLSNNVFAIKTKNKWTIKKITN